MKRGEIWMVDFGPVTGPEQAGMRPAIILQNDSLGQVFATTIVIPLTTNLRRLSLPQRCFLKLVKVACRKTLSLSAIKCRCEAKRV